jgi:hypothetical protein
MTREEAAGIAVEALTYALENDHQYLAEDTVAEWSAALDVLSQPAPEHRTPDRIKVYCYDRERGEDPHARVIEISREDANRFDALRERERVGRRAIGRYVRVTDLVTTTPVEIASHPCAADCHCGVVVRDVPITPTEGAS